MSKVEQEISRGTKVVVAGEERLVKRMPLDKIKTGMEYLKEATDGIFDVFSGVSTETVEKINHLYELRAAKQEFLVNNPSETEIESEIADIDRQVSVLQFQMAQNSDNLSFINRIIDKLIEKHEVLYKLVGLAIDETPAWVGKNMFLEEAVDVLTVVIEQEFSASFFNRMGRLKTVYQRMMTPSDGSGLSQPN